MNPPPPSGPTYIWRLWFEQTLPEDASTQMSASWLNRFWEDFLKKNNKFSTILSYSPSNRALCLILTNLNTQYVLSLVEMEQLFWKSLKCIKVYGQFNSHTNKKNFSIRLTSRWRNLDVLQIFTLYSIPDFSLLFLQSYIA